MLDNMWFDTLLKPFCKIHISWWCYTVTGVTWPSLWVNKREFNKKVTNYNTFIVQKYQQRTFTLHYIIKEKYKSPKSPIHNFWSCLNCEIDIFCTLLFVMREFVGEFSQRACALNSSERLWLVNTFISSTESCVIGYNAQSCINASVSGSAPASERRYEFSSWWYDALNVLIMNDTTWLYQI